MTLDEKLLHCCILSEQDGTGSLNLIGLLAVPKLIVGGRDSINAAIVGQIQEGTVVAFRGTLPFDDESKPFEQRLLDWAQDFEAALVPWGFVGGKVHAGFSAAVDTLPMDLPKDKPVYFTGHSKGGAMAVLAAVAHFLAGGKVADVVTFGAPRAGDVDFAAATNRLPISIRRYEASGDIVPHVPAEWHVAELMAEAIGFKMPAVLYRSVGKLLFVRDDATIFEEGQSKFLDMLIEDSRVVDLGRLMAEKKFAEIREAHGITAGHLYFRAVQS